MGPVLFFALFPAVVHSQTQASLGVGVGTVRHAGGSSFGAATVAPAAQRLSHSLYMGAGGALSLLEGGGWAAQGRGDLWAATRGGGSKNNVRLAASVMVAASTRSDGVAAAAGSALAEVVWTANQGGAAVGVGSAGGFIEGVSGIAALRLRGRGWWQSPGRTVQLALSAESTRFLGAWYTDLVGGFTLDRARLVASLWTSARVSSVYGSTGAASVALQYFVTPTVAFEVAGGNYLRDPFQGLPRAGFASGGVRFHSARRPPSPPPPAPSLPTGLAPLIAEHRGDSVVVRFRMDAARSVAIAGDWNDWAPRPLRPLGDDIWEAAFVLAAGTYHFSLLVDGTEWVVPGGVAVVSDGMGGLVAVLTVL